MRGRSALSTCALMLSVQGYACRSAPPEHDAATTQASAQRAPGTSQLRIDDPRHDFGTVVQGEVLHHTFDVTNVGSQRFEFDSSSEALGCQGSVEPKVLAARARGRFLVTCRAEYFGPLRVTLPLRRDSSAVGQDQVELTGDVTPLLGFDTRLIEISLPFGETRSVETHLIGALSSRARLAVKDAGNAGLDVTVLPGAGQRPAGLRLRLEAKKVGTFVGNVLLSTHLPELAEISLPYSCKVLGSLSVSPSTPYFDLSAAGPKVQTVSVHSSQPGFVLRDVKVLEGPFTTAFSRDQDESRYKITITVREDKIWDLARAALGRIVIVSNDRSEPRKELPLFGFGALNRSKDAGQ